MEKPERKVPVVDLSASKVMPKFMVDLKKTVNKNMRDALEAEDLLPKPLTVIEMDNGESERKVPVVDLSASKVTPKFMADLKKTVNKNICNALEAEDLLLTVIENR